MTKFNSINARALTAGTWVIHSEQTLAAAASSVSITGLDGNTNHEYRIITRIVGGNGAATSLLRLGFDGGAVDTGNNYGQQNLAGQSSSASAVRETANSGWKALAYVNATSEISMADVLVCAKSGYIRTSIGRYAERISGTTVNTVGIRGEAHSNTSGNLTSIEVNGGVSNGLGIGTYILVLKKVESTTTANAFNSLDVPIGKLTGDCWETVAEGTLGADATSYTISGLDGDTDVIYELEERLISTADNNWQIRPNNDSATNYGYQVLYGNNSTVAAGRGTYTGFLATVGANPANSVSTFNTLFYAKQGYTRTALTQIGGNISGTTASDSRLGGYSWSVTNTNVTSIVRSHSSANGIKAGSYYRLKALKRKV